MADPHSSQSQPVAYLNEIEMDHTSVSRSSSPRGSEQGRNARPSRHQRFSGLGGHTLGLLLLLCTVCLWTLSNFLGSSIFADNTYAKPFFLTYLNTSMFMLALIPNLMRSAYNRHQKGNLYSTIRKNLTKNTAYRQLPTSDTSDPEIPDSEPFINKTTSHSNDIVEVDEKHKHLGLIPTSRLALQFCFLWFGANFFAVACLQYTTVASTTILTSTSSLWTLILGAFTGTEIFTWRKLCGVVLSLFGIILISTIDLTTNADSMDPVSDPDRLLRMRRLFRRIDDQFPDKPASELALGDALALTSAIIYGIYTITLKKSTIKALPRQLNMTLFFGLVGTFNIFLLFPLFPLLHFTGIETFQTPPTRHVWMILLVNSISSLLSDICWAYAMVLTSPLVVTVGLSLTIPLSLVGEMVLQGHYEGWVYWIGAGIVVGSFVFVDHEEREDEEALAATTQRVAHRTNSFGSDVDGGHHSQNRGRSDDDLGRHGHVVPTHTTTNTQPQKNKNVANDDERDEETDLLDTSDGE
ncbi:hypothetical protein PV10_04189 [Exophiala mesophila]|uniref:EamA domain-containing protein n=1 Tax=Exophiala mesophila TaxID=212818 RepID=A0A0D2A1N3_EXOME|nr:uncharacterized protein PV10_04189 [Exophiala mesophila]KIV92933.1 hypothetical protein PV10_04189 [Exophiala mesophila]